MPNALLTLKEAAPRINLEEATLLVYVWRGKIPSIKNRGRRMIYEEDLDHYTQVNSRFGNQCPNGSKFISNSTLKIFS